MVRQIFGPLWLALLLWVSQSQGAESAAIQLSADASRVSLVGQVGVLRDLSGQMTVAQAVTAAAQGRFDQPTGNIASGYMPGNLWLRFTLARNSAAPQRWWLEVDGYLEHLDLFLPRPDGAFDIQSNGMETPFSQRLIPHHNPVFILDLPAGTAQTYYLRIPIDGARRLRLVAWQAQPFQLAAANETLLQGAYFGMVMLLVILNLGYWAWQREGLYGYYAFYVLTLAIYFFNFKGYLSQLADPPSGLSVATARITLSLWLALNASLLSRLLHLGQHMPRFDQAFRILFKLVALVAVLTVLSGDFIQIASFLNLTRMIAVLASLILPIILLKRGVQEAKLYLLAFGFLLAAALLNTLEQQGLVIIPGDVSLDTLLQIAALPHVIVMHMMVARRLRRLSDARLQAEQALLLQQQQQAEQSQFLSLLAHEIRNPLTIVDGAAQLLALKGQAEPDMLAQIRNAAGRIADLLKNCLSSERISGSGWQPHRQVHDLRQIAHTAVAKHPSSRHDIRCQVEQLPTRFLCDQTLIQVLLDNLMDNAIKYSPDGGVITLRGWIQAGAVLLSVEDQGVGIPAEQVTQVFQRFHRTRQVAEVPGAGLGLNMVQRIAELHGGNVSCSSVPGRGTRMTVRLPVQEEN